MSVGSGTSVTEDKLIAVGMEVGCVGAQAVKTRPLKTKHLPSIRSGLHDNRKRFGALSEGPLRLLIFPILRAFTLMDGI